LIELSMPADDILLDSEDRMEKAVDVFKHAMTGIRTGRANPGLVDSLRVEVYGAATPMKSVAQVGAPEPTQIVIRPFDPSTIKDIEKAIRSSDLGLNPQNDGRVIRINIPPLSTDVRRKLVSRIKDLGEEAKVAIRNVRRDGNKAADQEQKDKTLTEDDRDALKDEIQELTKKFEAKVEAIAKAKEAEVMEN
jgi:ribosome recycling factor